MHDAAVSDGRLGSNPARGVKLPPLPQADTTALSADQVHRLVANAPAPYDLLLEVLAWGGRRFGEAVALRRSRCDLLRSRLMVAESLAEVSGRFIFGPTKTHQQRGVVLPGFVRDHLAAHLAAIPDDPSALLFTAPAGGPLRYSNFYRRVRRPSLDAAGLPAMKVHRPRHSCASLLVAQGVTVKALQAQLGHRDPSLTLRVYSHLYGDEHDELARRLDAAYGAGVSQVRPTAEPTSLRRAVDAS